MIPGGLCPRRQVLVAMSYICNVGSMFPGELYPPAMNNWLPITPDVANAQAYGIGGNSSHKPVVSSNAWREVFCRNPPAVFSSQLIVDVHQFQCNGYYPGRYHAIAFVPSPAGKMVPIDTGTRVYQEMYGASGDEVFETAKVCHMEPVRFDTRGYTGNVL